MIQTKYTKQELTEIVQQFQDYELDPKRWNHEAHLIVALWFLARYPRAEATHYLRTGIISYHSSQGGKHTLERGYHETLTQFWIWAVYQFLQEDQNRELPFEEQVEKLLQSEWGDKKLPWRCYSHDYLMSVEARAYWKEPNL